MSKLRDFLCATTLFAGLCLSGLQPAAAGPNSPSPPSPSMVSPPRVAPVRPDFSVRAPRALRDDDGIRSIPKTKKKSRRATRIKSAPVASEAQHFPDTGPKLTPATNIEQQAGRFPRRRGHKAPRPPGAITIPIPGQQPAGTLVPAASEKAVPIFGLVEHPVEVSILGIVGRPWLLPSVQKIRDSYSGPLHNPLLVDPGPLSKQTNAKAAKSLLTRLENAPQNRVDPGPLPAKANAAVVMPPELKAEPPAVPLKAELPAAPLCDFQGGCSVPSPLKAGPPAAPSRESAGGTASGPPIGILLPAPVQGGSDAEKAAGIQSRSPSGTRDRDRKSQ